MKLDGLHVVSLGIGIAIGFFLVPMIISWVSAKRP